MNHYLFPVKVYLLRFVEIFTLAYLLANILVLIMCLSKNKKKNVKSSPFAPARRLLSAPTCRLHTIARRSPRPFFFRSNNARTVHSAGAGCYIIGFPCRFPSCCCCHRFPPNHCRRLRSGRPSCPSGRWSFCAWRRTSSSC